MIFTRKTKRQPLFAMSILYQIYEAVCKQKNTELSTGCLQTKKAAHWETFFVKSLSDISYRSFSLFVLFFLEVEQHLLLALDYQSLCRSSLQQSTSSLNNSYDSPSSPTNFDYILA